MNRLYRFLTIALLIVSVEGHAQSLLHYWNFNNTTSESTILAPTSTIGGGTITVVNAGTSTVVSVPGDLGGQGFDTNNANARNGDLAVTHLRYNSPSNAPGASLTFAMPTTGYRDVVVKYTTRRSSATNGAEKQVIDYSIDGTNFVNFTTITTSFDAPVLQSFDFSAIAATDNNPNFKLKISFEKGVGGTGGNNRFDNFTMDGFDLNGDTSAPTVTFSPLAASTNVFINTTPKITFSEDVRLINNSAIDNTNVDALVELKLTNAAGADVAFDATVSGKVITITPTSPLKYSQVYYVAVKANVVEDLSDNAIASVQSSTFETIVPQTTFNAGDLAFVAYRTNATGTPDEVSFITFVSIIAGTQINFTDAKVTDNGQCAGGFVWTAPVGGVAANTVINIRVDSPFDATKGTVAGSSFGLSSGGEQVIVYTGSNTAPNYVTALSTNAWNAANTSCSGSESRTPAGLTDGQTSLNTSTAPGNVSGIAVNAYYNGPRTGAVPNLRASILNPANWVAVGAGTPAQEWPSWDPANNNSLVAFDKKIISVNENSGTVSIKLKLTNPVSGSVDLKLVAGAGTAGANDFTYASQTVTLSSTDVEKTIEIPIISDNTHENDEYFVLMLESALGYQLGTIKVATVYIKDDDSKAPAATKSIELKYVSSFDPGTSTAEIVQYDKQTKRMFIISSIQDRLDIADFSNPAAITKIKSIDMAPYGGITSVAVKNGIVAVASPNANDQLAGSVVFFDTDGNFKKQVAAGVLPDMITFSPDGKLVLTANEGQPNDAYTSDPEGTVTIVDISGGIEGLTQNHSTTLTFQSFNAQEQALIQSGVRKLKLTSTLAQDLEPEYIYVAANSEKAWVTLQENNAMGEIDLKTKTITSVWALGMKDHMQPDRGLDASDNSGAVVIANWPVKSFYLPDGVAGFAKNGVQYLVTANEGDEKEYAGLTERTTVGASNLDATAFPFASILKEDHNLGRLRMTRLSGDTDNDGDFDEIHIPGTRSFSIWNAQTKQVVFDSGDDFERITSTDTEFSALFNADNESNTLKSRSRAKGPEPEGVTVATLNDRTYAFIALERVGGVMVYDITDPASAKFVDYKNSRSVTSYTGDHGPEGIIFIGRDESPNQKAYIAVANEISGTVSVYEVLKAPKLAQTITNFAAVTDKTVGDAAFDLTGMSSYNLPIAFAADGAEVTIAASKATIVKAGKVTITASQAGNDDIAAAEPVSTTFCIKPAKPTITAAGSGTAAITLTSSANEGNVWSKNGTAIDGAILQTLQVTTEGNYTVVVSVETCTSVISDPKPITITGDIPSLDNDLMVSPNPAESKIMLQLPGNGPKSIRITNSNGVSMASMISDRQDEVIDIAEWSAGLYVVRISVGEKSFVSKFIRK